MTLRTMAAKKPLMKDSDMKDAMKPNFKKLITIKMMLPQQQKLTENKTKNWWSCSAASSIRVELLSMEWLAEARRFTEGIVSDSTEVLITKLTMAIVPRETCLAEVNKKYMKRGKTVV